MTDCLFVDPIDSWFGLFWASDFCAMKGFKVAFVDVVVEGCCDLSGMSFCVLWRSLVARLVPLLRGGGELSCMVP